jgi:hypothetical protein
MVVADKLGAKVVNGGIFCIGKFFVLEVGPPNPGRGWVVSATGTRIFESFDTLF